MFEKQRMARHKLHPTMLPLMQHGVQHGVIRSPLENNKPVYIQGEDGVNILKIKGPLHLVFSNGFSEGRWNNFTKQIEDEKHVTIENDCYVYVDEDLNPGTIPMGQRVVYNSREPEGQREGDYWFDIAYNQMKKYENEEWVDVNIVIIAQVTVRIGEFIVDYWYPNKAISDYWEYIQPDQDNIYKYQETVEFPFEFLPNFEFKEDDFIVDEERDNVIVDEDNNLVLDDTDNEGSRTTVNIDLSPLTEMLKNKVSWDYEGDVDVYYYISNNNYFGFGEWKKCDNDNNIIDLPFGLDLSNLSIKFKQVLKSTDAKLKNFKFEIHGANDEYLDEVVIDTPVNKTEDGYNIIKYPWEFETSKFNTSKSFDYRYKTKIRIKKDDEVVFEDQFHNQSLEQPWDDISVNETHQWQVQYQSYVYKKWSEWSDLTDVNPVLPKPTNISPEDNSEIRDLPITLQASDHLYHHSKSKWRIKKGEDIVYETEEFDLSNIDDWEILDNNFSIYDNPSFKETTVFGIETNSANKDIAKYTIPCNKFQPSNFSFYWYETSSSTGGGLRLFDDEGNLIVGFASDNDQWDLQDADGWHRTKDTDNNYEVWTCVNLKFDWENGTYNYEIKRLSDDYKVEGTKNLNSTNPIKEIYISEYHDYNWGGDGRMYMWFVFPIHLSEHEISEKWADDIVLDEPYDWQVQYYSYKYKKWTDWSDSTSIIPIMPKPENVNHKDNEIVNSFPITFESSIHPHVYHLKYRIKKDNNIVYEQEVEKELESFIESLWENVELDETHQWQAAHKSYYFDKYSEWSDPTDFIIPSIVKPENKAPANNKDNLNFPILLESYPIKLKNTSECIDCHGQSKYRIRDKSSNEIIYESGELDATNKHLVHAWEGVKFGHEYEWEVKYKLYYYDIWSEWSDPTTFITTDKELVLASGGNKEVKLVNGVEYYYHYGGIILGNTIKNDVVVEKLLEDEIVDIEKSIEDVPLPDESNNYIYRYPRYSIDKTEIEVDKPIGITPKNSTRNIRFPITLKSSKFEIHKVGDIVPDTHGESYFRIRKKSTEEIVFEDSLSYKNKQDLTTYTVDELWDGYEVDVEYEWQVKYKTAYYDVETEWSEWTSFIISSVKTPDILQPEDINIYDHFPLTLETAKFSMTKISMSKYPDIHKDTKWIIRKKSSGETKYEITSEDDLYEHIINNPWSDINLEKDHEILVQFQTSIYKINSEYGSTKIIPGVDNFEMNNIPINGIRLNEFPIVLKISDYLQYHEKTIWRIVHKSTNEVVYETDELTDDLTEHIINEPWSELTPTNEVYEWQAKCKSSLFNKWSEWSNPHEFLLLPITLIDQYNSILVDEDGYVLVE